jgi:muramidase (phage lysozyme)
VGAEVIDRGPLRAALEHPNVRAFLRTIRQGESGQGDDAFTICYGGSHFAAPPWDHPRTPIKAGGWTSTAAGAYQFLARTWDALVAQYGFEDFSPECQHEGAVALIKGRKALDDVISGRFTSAIRKCNKEWASLPDSPYGQPVMTMDEALLVYKAWGGELAEPDTQTTHYDTKEASMPAPLLVNLIPALASVFKPGSEVAQRNVAAATVVANTLVEATKSPNLQAAIERMQDDPAALQAATAAVTAPEIWNQIAEVGGGIVEARKSAGSTDQIPFYKNAAFIFWITVAPLVYAGVYAVLFGPAQFSDDAKMMVLTALFTGVLGAGTGFFLGSSLSSQRKDATLTRK